MYGTTFRSADAVRTATVIAALAAILALPAIWNGYPLLYHDTEDYVTMSFTWDPPLWRTVPYALVVAVARPFGSLWAVVALQALFGAWVLHEVMSAFLPRTTATKWLVGIGLSVGASTLPWATSEIMPDAFTGFVPLIIATLAFGERLGPWRSAALAVAGSVAVMVHLSHVAVALGLALVLCLLRLASVRFHRLPRPALRLALTSILVGTFAVPMIHMAGSGTPFFTRGGRVLQLALFVQNGVAKTYLDAVCPQGVDLKLCPYRDRLPTTADAFLWAPWASPFWKLGGWVGMQHEADEIVNGAIQKFPLQVAAAAVENSWTQYWAIRLGDGLDPKDGPNRPGEFYDVGRLRYPADFSMYISARQQAGTGIDFHRLNAILVPLAVIGRALILIGIGLAVHNGDRRAAGLGATVVVALLGNAIVCGALSNPHDRYQSRVVWDALAGALILAARQIESRERRALETAGEITATARL